MNRSIAAIMLAGATSFATCSGDDYYAQFRTIATNLGLVVTTTNGSALTSARLESPLLVDTLNTSCKLTGKTNSLADMLATGAVGDVRLGASMTDVVHSWGKPPCLYSSLGIGPQFIYSDVALGFRDGRVAAITLSGKGKLSCRPDSTTVAFDGGLTLLSQGEEWLTILSTHKWLRHDAPGGFLYAQSANGCTISVQYDTGRQRVVEIYLRVEPIPPRVSQ